MERVNDVPGSCKVTEMDRLSSKREVNLLNEQERVREAATVATGWSNRDSGAQDGDPAI